MADLSILTDDELKAMRGGDFSKISNEKLQALRQSLATSGTPEQPQAIFPSIGELTPPQEAKVEPQRLRSMAQGLSLGTSDRNANISDAKNNIK